MHMDIRVIEVTDCKSEVRFDLRAVWRPQWPRRYKNWDQKGDMHMDIRVIEVTDFKTEVRFDLRGRLEAAIASKI